MLGTIKRDLQSIVKEKCKHLSADSQRSYCSNSLMSCLLMAFEMAGKTKPVSYHQGREYLTITKLSQYKNKTKHTKYPHQVERLHKLVVLK